LLIGFLYAADSSRLAIIKLFPPTEKLDQQTQQRITRMRDIGLSPDQIMKIEQVSPSQLQNVVVISNETNVVKGELAETTKQALEEGQQP
jgi:fructose-1,6-bisphosphatase/sedoheptulose 1,7-bisphosphatase-like protein